MKKFVKAFLTMAMCFSMLSSNALAAESEIPGLSVLADEYISVSVSNTEIVYSNLQEFYVAAKEEIPAISDIELAYQNAGRRICLCVRSCFLPL